MAISGEATEILEGKEIPIKAGDVIFIPRREKHTTVNTSHQEFRYLEFFTCPPVGTDFVEPKLSDFFKPQRTQRIVSYLINKI